MSVCLRADVCEVFVCMRSVIEAKCVSAYACPLRTHYEHTDIPVVIFSADAVSGDCSEAGEHPRPPFCHYNTYFSVSMCLV